MKNKIFTFKISLDKDIYRVIEVRANKSLYDLASAILRSFNFDMDHCFGFYNDLKRYYNSDEKYTLFADMDDAYEDEDAKSVKNTKICDVFEIKKKMLFMFDYGDEWHFLLQCQKITDAVAKVKYPVLVKEVGEAPEQYESYEDEELVFEVIEK